MQNIIRNFLLVSLLCLFITTAFAKAGYDSFKITINDPNHVYSGKVVFKYDCDDNHGQQQHSL